MFIRFREDRSIVIDQRGSALLGSFLSFYIGMIFIPQKILIFIIILIGSYFYEIYLHFSQKYHFSKMFQLFVECILLLTSTKLGMIMHKYL